MKTKYYQNAMTMIDHPSDETFAFTMRLCNFLMRFKIIKYQPAVVEVARYARRRCPSD